MPRFIAISVAQGDAFFFEREGFSVLVDGGRNRSSFPALFKNVTNKNGVDILICTHNDSDHTNGVLGLLEVGFRCDEVWLPGHWLGVLPDVLKPLVGVVEELVCDIKENQDLLEMGERWPGISPLESYADTLSEHATERTEESPESDNRDSITEDGWPESCLPMLEEADSWEWNPKMLAFWNLGERMHLRYHHNLQLRRAETKLLFSALDAASRIRAIATEAYHRGIKVRWFEFDPSAPSSGIPEIQPVNAREIAKVRQPDSPLLYRLALSVSNKQSLVFWCPLTEQHPGVLFTADSDLAGMHLPAELKHAIVTVPHHGSEANHNAYNAVNSAAQENFHTINWVRSDGRYRSRPGSPYLSLTSPRVCTICRLNSGMFTTKSAVSFAAENGKWNLDPERSACSCK